MNYEEGSCFAVPLRDGGFARGVITCWNGDNILAGYFFGPRIASLEDLEVDESMVPGLEMLIARFGNIGLKNKSWPMIGQVPHWNRNDWKLPRFLKIDNSSNECRLRTYDNTTLEFISEEVFSLHEINPENFHRSGLLGHGAVEIILTKQLSKPSAKVLH